MREKTEERRMANPLRECPFCGSGRTRIAEFKGIYFAVCDECQADGPAKDEKADAVEAWNTRAPSKGDGHD